MKSTVSVERKRCLVCSILYETGAVLIKGPTAPLSPQAWGLCPEHAALRNRNLIAMVEVNPDQSRLEWEDHMLPEEAHRTGTVVYLSRHLFQYIFYGDPPDSGVCYVPPDVIASLQKLMQIWDPNRKDH